jgi:hypothetical protein
MRAARSFGACFGFLMVWVCFGCESAGDTSVLPEHPARPDGIWISHDELMRRPMTGPAWEALKATAALAAPSPDLSNQDDPSNVRIFAKALVAVRTNDAAMVREVREACRAVRGSEARGTALSVGRELLSYVLAADLVGLDGAERKDFEDWLRRIQKKSFRGRTLRSTHEERPNNWGTHAGASRIAVAVYLGDAAEVLRAAPVFSGWMGEAEGWQEFDFGARDWQPEGSRDYGVNPRGAVRSGHPIAGVLPDDQRRGGPFAWPPPKENYVYEALQGAVAQAAMLERLGFDAWTWGDRAILRAMSWLHDEANFPAEGDDTWIPWLVNRAYGTNFPAPVPSRPGKALGFTDWTHGDAAPAP